MNFIIITIFTLLCVICSSASFEFIFKKYGMCEGKSDYPMKHYGTFTKINKTITIVDANFTVPFPIDDEVMINTLVEKQDSKGKWKKIYSSAKKDPCKLMKKDPGYLSTAINEGLKIPVECPWPAGVYQGKDIIIDVKKIRNTQMIPKGTLRTFIQFTRVAKEFYCLNTEIEFK